MTSEKSMDLRSGERFGMPKFVKIQRKNARFCGQSLIQHETQKIHIENASTTKDEIRIMLRKIFLMLYDTSSLGPL